MKEINNDIRKYTIMRIVAFIAMLSGFACMICLYMSNFYPVIVNGVESTFRHVIRYGMYGILILLICVAGYFIDLAEQKLKELKKLRRKKLRGR